MSDKTTGFSTANPMTRSPIEFPRIKRETVYHTRCTYESDLMENASYTQVDKIIYYEIETIREDARLSPIQNLCMYNQMISRLSGKRFDDSRKSANDTFIRIA